MRKQRALLAAHAAADLHDDVFIVIRVARQQQHLQLLLQLGKTPFCLPQLLLTQLAQLLVRLAGEHRAHVVQLLLRFEIRAVRLHDRLQLLLLTQQLCRRLRIGVKIRLRRARLHLQIALLHKPQFFQHTFRSLPFILPILPDFSPIVKPCFLH